MRTEKVRGLTDYVYFSVQNVQTQIYCESVEIVQFNQIDTHCSLCGHVSVSMHTNFPSESTNELYIWLLWAAKFLE